MASALVDKTRPYPPCSSKANSAVARPVRVLRSPGQSSGQLAGDPRTAEHTAWATLILPAPQSAGLLLGQSSRHRGTRWGARQSASPSPRSTRHPGRPHLEGGLSEQVRERGLSPLPAPSISGGVQLSSAGPSWLRALVSWVHILPLLLTGLGNFGEGTGLVWILGSSCGEWG